MTSQPHRLPWRAVLLLAVGYTIGALSTGATNLVEVLTLAIIGFGLGLFYALATERGNQ